MLPDILRVLIIDLFYARNATVHEVIESLKALRLIRAKSKTLGRETKEGFGNVECIAS
ncbi:hypothetical protein NSU_4711 [Novosphingobium pentaromativorans US6-1]|uniref:Uncharacterized protein n=1 Tax=Novosphingobium pentaromativorans US6-1 TaxID=1088721 RepID=G6EK40_9SPHN|nr:hypothetical protein NSU_4711 [Novosphingobium pentaromativorans US6-1]